MAEQKKIRLSALARTFSVGAHHLMEHLNKKGLGEGINPNSLLSSDQIGALEKEFGGAKVERVDVREVIRTTVQQTKAATAEQKEEEEPQELKVKSNTLFTPPRAEVAAPKVLGKIDLDAKKGATESTAQEPKQAEVAPEQPVQPAQVAQPVQAAVEVAKVESSVESTPKPVADPAPVVEKAKTSEPVSETQTAESPSQNTRQETTKQQVSNNGQAQKGADHKRQSAVKNGAVNGKEQKTAQTLVTKQEIKEEQTPQREKNAQPELFRANETEKLAGPKILGKMVLPTPNDNQGQGRNKRNRIKKNRVDISNVAGGANSSNGGGQHGGGANQRNNNNRRPAGENGGAGNNNNGAANNGANNANRNGNHNAGGGAQKRNNNNNFKGKNNRPAQKPVVKEQVSDEEVQKQIKETLARLTNKGSKTKSSKYRRDKREAIQGRMAEEAEMMEQKNSVLQVTEFVTVSELATMMDVQVGDVITACMNLGLMVSINQRLDAEALSIVAEEFGFKVDFVSVEIQEAIDNDEDNPEDLVPRPPIVTVMGHVDHGKTSLLDYIRNANVIAGEAGGITQHIGAYSVKLEDGRKVTFLDTPGHEAFTAMRARGAKVTDVAIIIIAADDAIMPQTKEAINHAEAAGVPIVFAINKVDKPGANPERIKEQLSAMNYLVEDWGGKYQSQDISAKSGMNVDKLLEKIVLESELLELQANPKRKAMGSVIESTLDKGRGYVTTVLVQNGTLRVGDVMLSGTYTGRVKAMFNERGKKIKEAGPATPVLVLGLNGASQAGDLFNVMDDDRAAREIANKREQLQRMQGLRTQKHITLDEIGRRIAIGSFKELNIIIKGDVDGSIEALTGSLIKLSTEEVQVNVIHKAVGAISESDVLLAAASNAIICGFQVRPSAAARKLAEKEEIDIRLYSIIYDAINEIKDAIEGMLAPETKEEVTASVEVLETFKISKVGTIAGCLVREGKITRGNSIRVIRDGIVVYQGKLASLKRFKEEVKEVNVHTECGLAIENYNDIKVGDMVESYTVVEIARKL